MGVDVSDSAGRSSMPAGRRRGNDISGTSPLPVAASVTGWTKVRKAASGLRSWCTEQTADPGSWPFRLDLQAADLSRSKAAGFGQAAAPPLRDALTRLGGARELGCFTRQGPTAVGPDARQPTPLGAGSCWLRSFSVTAGRNPIVAGASGRREFRPGLPSPLATGEVNHQRAKGRDGGETGPGMASKRQEAGGDLHR